MDTNEIMLNDEVMEATEEIATAGSEKGFKVVAGVGLAVIAGVIVYKYVAKPIIAKIKARKEQQVGIVVDSTDLENSECEEIRVAN